MIDVKIPLTLVLILALSFEAAKGIPNTNLTQVLCNGAQYFKNDPFAISLAYVLAELVSTTPSRHGYDYHNISPYPNAFAYGHAACNNNTTTTSLTTQDCKTCLASAKDNLLTSCDARIGGRVLLVDCTMRYEQYPFDD
ncbi:antifungal protein ginkbilobin-like protein [Solanum verrucosum]|uniref:antifungal protein ginkbilobin-like protein n=1 Tax=Solanum verrucosum TaxID=315347 RepID=UPI0020D00F63|nr:antifungal protein ginkbilobin-like protein [Solanum verrucosum]